MRNKLFGTGFPALLLCLAGAVYSQEQKPEEEEQAVEKPAGEKSQEPAATDDTAQKDEKTPEEAAAEAKAPKRFVPSTRTNADNSSTFPVDI